MIHVEVLLYQTGLNYRALFIYMQVMLNKSYSYQLNMSIKRYWTCIIPDEIIMLHVHYMVIVKWSNNFGLNLDKS